MTGLRTATEQNEGIPERWAGLCLTVLIAPLTGRRMYVRNVLARRQ
jgi:hypothetical protein